MSFSESPVVGIEATAIVLGVFLSGHLMSLSTITMPILVQTASTSQHVLTQWALVFGRGHIQGPFLAITTLLLDSYAAWARASVGQDWKVFALAGALTIGIVPYTWVTMSPLNSKLFELEARGDEGKSTTDKNEAARLINRWTLLHAGRSMLPLAGGIVAMLGLQGKWSF